MYSNKNHKYLKEVLNYDISISWIIIIIILLLNINNNIINE